MGGVREIVSLQNPELKRLALLKDRRAREREGLFLVEGARELARADRGGVALRAVYTCPELFSPEARAVEARLPGERVRLARSAFEKLSHRENGDGLIGLAEVPRRAPPTLRAGALVLVLLGLEKPGNLGALLRTADGVGVDAVLVAGGGTDLVNPNVIRASQGSVFTLPVFTLDEDAARAWLREQGLTLVACTPEASGTYWDADLSGPLALCLGTEHEGLPPGWRAAADVRVSIPMRGEADSLNVATAGALVLYEALRQRARVGA